MRLKTILAVIVAIVLIGGGLYVRRSFALRSSGADQASAGALDSSAPNPATASALAADDQARKKVATVFAGRDSALSRADTIDRLFAALQIAMDKLPRETFDVAAVVNDVGQEPEALLDWVRDHTYWVPYRGALRGATGVLMDRLGNSLDRSLLLAGLLQAAGKDARLAHATLTADQAKSVVAQARPVPENPTADTQQAAIKAADSALEQYEHDFQVDTVRLREALAQSARAAADLEGHVREQADRQAALLLTAVGKTSATNRDADSQTAAADHWWVQVEDEGTWKDLDPSLPNRQVGRALVPAGETIAPSDLPSALWHQVQIKVIVEQATQGRLQGHVALTQMLKPSELFDQRIVLEHQPIDWQPDIDLKDPAGTMSRLAESVLTQREWIPVLRVGDTEQKESAFTSAGEIESADTAGASANNSPADALGGGLFGGLGGGAEQKPAKKPAQKSSPDGNEQAAASEKGQLTAEWVEYEIQSPGVQPKTVRREVFDLVGPSARATKGATTITLTRTQRLERAFALLGSTTILPLAARPSPEFVVSQTVKALLADRETFSALQQSNGTDGGGDVAGQLADLRPVPGPIANLALVRQSWNTAGGDGYLASPNVLSYRTYLRPDPSGDLVAVEAFDIVANDIAVRPGSSRDPFEVRLRQGAFDSNAETFLLSGGSTTASTAEAFARAERAGSSWVTVRTPHDVAGLQLPNDARARILTDVTAGYAVVVPPNAAAGGVAWWRIDPKTGQTLGIGDRGWGQSTAELAVWNSRVLLKVLGTTFCLTSVKKLYQKSPTASGVVLAACVAYGTGGLVTLFAAEASVGYVAICGLIGDIAGAIATGTGKALL